MADWRGPLQSVFSNSKMDLQGQPPRLSGGAKLRS